MDGREEYNDVEQPTLWEDPDAQSFFAYHEANPEVYDYFKRFTFEKIRGGAKHIGSKAVMERIRWESPVVASGPFKVNNNLTPFYARLFMHDYPQHDGIFFTRTSQADKEI